MKLFLKEQAINLRRSGYSYSEILKKIPVAKSTLSLWLHSVNLSTKQKQRLTEKKLTAASRGWRKRSRQRIEKTIAIKQKARLDVSHISNETLWFMGIMLYWAEGAKQKDHSVEQGVCFSNSDPLMIKVLLQWLRICLEIPDDRISFDIYIHDSHKIWSNDVSYCWAEITGFPVGKFGKIYYKKHKVSTNRRNTGNNYHGLLRVKVTKSTDLNRKIAGWIEGICLQCGVV